ncbi:WLM domain-containing protein [Pestalotiopsis sp. NC0098]|nr:WLM domain-containing protein [Pestalotiopsis sp. NC0098]
MPIGIQRLNARKSQPNPRITFIKPLQGPDEAVAQDFLERIAAQCVPIMKEHHLTVMSLEEYEPNREFVGRNFNAGEVIQLVLKSRTGQWLPYTYVQMVMMHELAHCSQMNHSKAFWAVRNKYAEEMRQLWSKKYTGEGLWGRGVSLTTGQFEINTVLDKDALPDNTCGGTYRTKKPKRKAKDQLTYQQRKERRIAKKFGTNGMALGQDEAVKSELEGKKTKAKPRVAGSKRGRDLRAAAALARFDQQKKSEVEEDKARIKTEDETASDDEFETASEDESGESDAIDINGKQLLDGKGHRMIKVCEDENPEDGDAQNELQELQSSMNVTAAVAQSKPLSQQTSIKHESETELRLQDLPSLDKAKKPVVRERLVSTPNQERITMKNKNGIATTSEREAENRLPVDDRPRGPSASTTNTKQTSLKLQPKQDASARQATIEAVQKPAPVSSGICPMCSTQNGPVILTCSVCAHVLDTRKDSNAWACTSASCQGSQYRNAGDAGLCGVCGNRKPAL